MLTEKALDFLVGCCWEDLPPEVQVRSRRCLLDGLGALVAGFRTPVAAIMTRFAQAQHQGREARVLVTGERVSAVGAALVNGFAANALDIDDGHRLVKGHPGACLIPLLFPTLEVSPRPISGRELLSALVAGYELAIRAGMIRHQTCATYHSSGSWGALAGAALVGRLWDQNRPTIRRAVGTAEYHAPIGPMMKGIETPSMGKDSIGWGCLVAMSSALLAGQGFTGIDPLFNDAPDPGLMDELGVRYRILDLYFKPFSGCRWGQPALAGAIALVRAHGLTPDRIARLRVRTFAAAKALPTAHPGTTEEAQYSLVFPLAAALIDGEVGPDQVLPPRLNDPAILALSDRVEVEVDPDFEAAFPEKTLAEVIVETDSGESFSSGPMEPMWDASTGPPDEEELREKFLWLAAPVLGPDRARALAGLVLELDRQTDLGPLLELTQGRAR